MKLTLAEKIVISTNIFLVFILLALISLQFTMNKAGVNIRQILMPSSVSSIQSPSVESSDNSIDNNNIGPVMDFPELTKEEEISAKQSHLIGIGWVVIVIGGLLLLGGLAVKFFSS